MKERSRSARRFLSAPTVFFYLAIHRDSDKFVALDIFELDYLMSRACQFAPPAWFVGVLFNRFVLPAIHVKGDRLETLTASAANPHGLALQFDGRAAHHLRRNGAQQFEVQHLLVQSLLLRKIRVRLHLVNLLGVSFAVCSDKKDPLVGI
jgi:hypothetical protein